MCRSVVMLYISCCFPLPEASSAAGIAEEDEEGNYLTLA